MNEILSVERLLAAYMAEDADGLAPEQLVDDVLSATSRLRPDPRWLALLREPPMRARSRVAVGTSARRLVLAAAVVLVAAIGVAVLRPSSNTDVGGSSVQTAFPTPSPTLAPSPTSAPSSSVGVAGACDLMTPDEAGNTLHVTADVSARSLLHLDPDSVSPIPSGLCEFHAGQTSLFVLRYETGTGADAFAGWKESTGVEAVSGLGDDAVWDPAKTTLYILKGDRLVTIMPLTGPDPTLTLEAAKAIGAIVVTRM